MGRSIKENLLSIQNLNLSIGENQILKGLNVSVLPNEIVALVGESGSGKSVTAQVIMGLLPTNKTKRTRGSILFNQKELLTQSLPEWQSLRGNKIGMIFQEPQSSLNPSMECGKQVAEIGKQHWGKTVSKTVLKKRVLDSFVQVQLPNPERIYKAYPHQLSGGQKQRVMIAMALLCKPQLLIADEPTTALDVLVQKEIIQLIKSLQLKTQMSVLFISHDLALVADLADRIAVMKEGKIIEFSDKKSLFKSPQHPYTKGLLGARPSSKKRLRSLPTLSDFENGKVKTEFITTKNRKDAHKKIYAKIPLLTVKALEKTYVNGSSIFGKQKESKALHSVSFDLYPGETLGLVGASGCGKSTLAKSIVFLDPPTNGEVYWENKRIDAKNNKQINSLRKDIQFIFQDPYAALHPLKRIHKVIEEVLKIHTSMEEKERKNRVEELLNQVGLDSIYGSRYPHELSGGQRQRAVIARALAVEPKLLICDESVAALDLSVQAQVLNLLNELKDKLRLSYLFISHDLHVVRHLSDRILVMHNGVIVEENEADKLYKNPKTDYSRALVNAIPKGL